MVHEGRHKRCSGEVALLQRRLDQRLECWVGCDSDVPLLFCRSTQTKAHSVLLQNTWSCSLCVPCFSGSCTSLWSADRRGNRQEACLICTLRPSCYCLFCFLAVPHCHTGFELSVRMLHTTFCLFEPQNHSVILMM